MEYAVIEIAGDYAVLRSAEGVERQVALALLPDGTDEGHRLKFENFEYSRI